MLENQSYTLSLDIIVLFLNNQFFCIPYLYKQLHIVLKNIKMDKNTWLCNPEDKYYFQYVNPSCY